MILIDMSMPDNCVECRLYDADSIECPIYAIEKADYPSYRFEDCPLEKMGKINKAKWIQAYGYVTPGGDHVWVCSRCGKGLHVYGVESCNGDIADGQWVACPNCGAIMEDNLRYGRI